MEYTFKKGDRVYYEPLDRIGIVVSVHLKQMPGDDNGGTGIMLYDVQWNDGIISKDLRHGLMPAEEGS